MTYPPVRHAGPLEPRNLLFIIVVSVITGALSVPVRLLVSADIPSFALYATGPIVLFLWKQPPPFSAWQWWLRRVAWWTVAIAAGIALFTVTMLLTQGLPVVPRMLLGSIVANVTWTFILQGTVERRDDVGRGKLLVVSLILGLIFGLVSVGSYLLVDGLMP